MNGYGIFKSSIQLAIEKNTNIDNFISACNKLTDNYEVKNSVFSFNGQNLDECTTGFFVGKMVSEDCKSLRDTIKSLKNPVMKISESEGVVTYEVGEYYQAASDIDCYDAIYNISKRAYLNNKQ